MIKLIKPYISYDEVENQFKEILDSGMLTRGKYSAAFPEAIRAYTGAKHAFNATSATTALSAAAAALGVGPGDEVIVSDFSFPATVNIVEAAGATPVFADVDRETFNMLPEELEKKITPRTKAVVFVCALGNPSGLDDILQICRAHGLPLIDDAACAIGSRLGGVPVGNLCDIECFSFHPRKLLTAGEGGSITTSRDDLAEILDVKLFHGAKVENGHNDYVTFGYNYRLPEMQCAMLLTQLKKLDGIVAQRVEMQKEYAALLEPLGYRAQKHAPNAVHNMQSVVFVMPEGLARDGLIAHLKADGIESTIGTYCQSNCTYYKNKYRSVQPNGLYLEENTITLPCYKEVPVEQIADSIRRYHG